MVRASPRSSGHVAVELALLYEAELREAELEREADQERLEGRL